MAESIRVILPVCLVLGAVVFAWFFLRRRVSAPEDLQGSDGRSSLTELLIVLLCLAGIFLFPSHLREPILKKTFGNYAYINIPCMLALVISLTGIRRWTGTELICFAAWTLLLIPMSISNSGLKEGQAATAAAQTLLPLFLILYRMKPSARQKATGIFLLVFDVFIAVLLVCGIVERFTDHAILRRVCEWMEAAGLSAKSYSRYLEDARFSSIWGHPLTNALMFNAFFAVNVAWFRASGRKCPVPLFFVPALVGVLLCSSKTGITVCMLLLIISCWKYRKWFLVLIPILAIVYFLGLFDGVIARFAEGNLTTDRVDRLREYFASGINPLGFFRGYGDRSILSASSPVYAFNDGFEFPLMMHAYYYGILFALVHIGGVFAYTTWRLLKEKKWLTWLCLVLIFAEINTYNAYALRSQDVCWFFCFLAMIFLNLPEAEAREKPGS